MQKDLGFSFSTPVVHAPRFVNVRNTPPPPHAHSKITKPEMSCLELRDCVAFQQLLPDVGNLHLLVSSKCGKGLREEVGSVSPAMLFTRL